jgi:hypothetical protein
VISLFPFQAAAACSVFYLLLFYFFFTSASTSSSLTLLILTAKYLSIATLVALCAFQYCAIRQDHDDCECDAIEVI